MKTTTQDVEVVVQSHERIPSLVMKSDDDRTKKFLPNPSKRSFVALSSVKEASLNSRIYEGRMIVNGFHPQLSQSHTNYWPSNEVFKAMPRKTSIQSTLDERITNVVSDCRKTELIKMRKRQRLDPLDLIPPIYHCNQDRSDKTVMDSHFNDGFMESDVPQLVVNTGGRGVSCNQKFRNICGAPSQEPSASFTLFNLIVPSMRPKLFEIFSRAVRDTSQSNANNRKEKLYMAITLPCIPLPASKISQNATIIHMDDHDVEKYCFLCILSPAISNTDQDVSEQRTQSIGFIGHVRYVNENHLINLLHSPSRYQGVMSDVFINDTMLTQLTHEE